MSNTEQQNQVAEQQPPQLTGELVQKVIEAQVRLREIGGSKIINPRNEAEITGLKNFLSDVFLTYGAEFVGNWVVIQQEYSPLIQVLERLGNRLIVRHQAQRGPQPQQPESK